MSSPITILLVEDNVLLGHAMRALIRTEHSLQVIGEATDGEAAVALAAQLKPSVILMDVNLPGAFDGIEATRRILNAVAYSESPPKVVGMSATSHAAQAMLDAGAVAFMRKERATELLSIIKTLMGTEKD
ncbi:MAG: hypothetical protein JWM57_4116 [Phycisphaerales bacterium]|nr:hypothetical protein [Phycisphaerales bacterium]